MRPIRKLASALFRSLIAIALIFAQLGFLGMSSAKAAPNPNAGRVALVIGNANYRNVPALKNSTRDAALVAKSLRGVGFDVVEKTDVTRKSFLDAVQQAVTKANGVDTILFYFAGHGFQLDGHNYLVPTDAVLTDRNKIADETLSLDDLISTLSAKDRQTIIFLDACRDNPIPASARSEKGTKGLAQIETGSGLFVAFATQPGNVTVDGKGNNSPFSDALAANISREGSSISDMMINVRNAVEEKTLHRQTPWDQSSLRSQFYFKQVQEEESTAWTEDELSELQKFAKDNPAFLDKFKKSFHGLKVVQADPQKTTDTTADGATLRIEAADEKPAPTDNDQVAAVISTGPKQEPTTEVAMIDPKKEPPKPSEQALAAAPLESQKQPQPAQNIDGKTGGAAPSVDSHEVLAKSPNDDEATVVDKGASSSDAAPSKPGLQILASAEPDDMPSPSAPKDLPSSGKADADIEIKQSAKTGRPSKDTGQPVTSKIELAPAPSPEPPSPPEMQVAALAPRLSMEAAPSDVQSASPIPEDKVDPVSQMAPRQSPADQQPAKAEADGNDVKAGTKTDDIARSVASEIPAIPTAVVLPSPIILEKPASPIADSQPPVEISSSDATSGKSKLVSPETAPNPPALPAAVADDKPKDRAPALTPAATLPPAPMPVQKPVEIAALEPSANTPITTPEPPASTPPAVALPEPPVINSPDPDTQKKMAKAVQKQLARLGCYVGAQDGDWSSRSAKALLRYYTQKKDDPDELEPTSELLSRLEGEPTVVCKSAPVKVPVVRSQPATAASPSPRAATARSTASAAPRPAAPAAEKLKTIKAIGVFR